MKDVSDEANDASDSDERDDLRLPRLLPKLLPAAKLELAWALLLLSAEILCQAAGSIICYGLLGYSKIFLLINGDCRCRWGMTSRSGAEAAASGQMSCSDFARSQELALSFLSENELIKFFSVAPMPLPGVCESAE